jgi:transposase InsO family protein
MCRVLAVSAAGYYAAQTRPPSRHARADDELLPQVRDFFARSRGTYGAPRIHRDFLAAGRRIGKKRVARLMRQDGLVARRRRAAVRTTDSGHAHPRAPNHLDRQFALEGDRDDGGTLPVNRIWVSDITYLPTQEGFLYLAVVLDLASRRVVGWAMQASLETELALAALRMAITQRRPASGVLHHSDQGVQYACRAYQDLLAAHQMTASMSKRGDCWDNAVAESFFSTLEFELVAPGAWQTRADARRAVFAYIEGWYNRARRHSTLGYRSPAEYERELDRAAA